MTSSASLSSADPQGGIRTEPAEPEKKRIGFLIDFRVFGDRDGKGFRSDDPILLFASAFGAYFDEVVLIARLETASDSICAPYALPEHVRLVPLPAYPRISHLYLHPLRYWGRIDAALQRTLPELDALWLNFGHPVSHRALRRAEMLPKLRCFAALRGATYRDAALRTRGPALARGLAGLVMWTQMRLFARDARRRRTPCLAFGSEMAEQLRTWGLEPIPMQTSLLSTAQIDAAPEAKPELACDLLVVSRLAPEKGVDVVLEALPDLRSHDGRPATLRIVGSGVSEAELRQRVAELGLGERVYFDGHLRFGPQLLARYRSAALLVIPSRTEGMPKVAYEAMALGCPVLATSVGGLPEIIGPEGERGRLVPPDDAGALARAASELLADPDALRSRAEAARAYGRGFTMEGQVRHILSRVAPDRLSAAT